MQTVQTLKARRAKHLSQRPSNMNGICHVTGDGEGMGWDPRLPLHIQLVIYESCTHIAHLLITKETAAFPPPIPIFVPVDFSMSLLVSRRLI